jgi:hypothetical protein
MKKQSLSLFMLFSLALSIPNPSHAFSLKERAEQLTQKAIALAKKGGAKSKELWDKINFMGKANKELNAAKKMLGECQMKHCKTEKEAYEKVDSAKNKFELKACTQQCPNELKRLNRAIIKKRAAVFYLSAILTGSSIAGLGITVTAIEETPEEEKRASQKIEQELEERRHAKLIEKGQRGSEDWERPSVLYKIPVKKKD